MRKKTILFIGMIFLVALIAIVSSAQQNYCCEKTKTGAWCINSAGENCETSDGLRMTPTSCEATSYCKLGTCYDKLEGTCMKNTPQRVCQDSDGIWNEGEAENLSQCQLGCCLVGDQAAFVTQVRCNRLSSIYNLEINFRKDVSNELECIASATSDVKGACVFENNFQNDCKFTTKGECSGMKSGNSSTNFHEGYLCSADSLNTICGPSENTICVGEKDEVYFTDTCGNLANIYDANWKTTKPDYWSKIYDTTESCGYGESNSDSRVCGNCNYYRGSTCKKYKSNQDKTKPEMGNNICRDLGCEWDGQRYEHGETWCAAAKGVSQIISFSETTPDAESENLPGSRYFRLVCYDNEVTIEPCADYRQEVCTQSSLNGFATAVCRVNRWQDCYSQDNQDDCENRIRRDCQWTKDVELYKNIDDGSCIPLYTPGFNFWGDNSWGDSICDQASKKCTVEWEEGLIGDKKCVNGCECITDGWEDDMNKVCESLGDCGSKTNYIGVDGYYDSSAFYSKEEAKDEK